MRSTRFALVAVLGMVAAAVVATPVAAASSTAEYIYGLNADLLWVAIPITLITQGALLYAVLKFRNNDEPRPTKENRRLEITWTVATAIVLLFVGLAAYGVMAQPDVTGPQPEIEDDDVEIDVQAFAWGWNFDYETDDGEEFRTTNTGEGLVIPADTQVYFHLTSADWLHGFHVPDLGLKHDVFPEQTFTITTQPQEPGVYQGYCSEYCGQLHSQMNFPVTIVEPDEFDEWVDEQADEGGDEPVDEDD